MAIFYVATFDCVDHNKLWKILKEIGIPDHLTCLLRNLYQGQEPWHEATDWFHLEKGVCQGCILSPCLFNLYVESVHFSSSVVSDSLQLHEPQHARPSCPSLTPRVHLNPCPLSQWCHPTISSSVVPFSSWPQPLPSIRVFFNESALRMRWPKYWRFSFIISPSNEHPGLISFKLLRQYQIISNYWLLRTSVKN